MLNTIKNWYKNWKLPEDDYSDLDAFLSHDSRMKKEYPVRYFLQDTLPYFFKRQISGRWSNVIDWVVQRTICRAHVVKIKSLKPGNPDEDTILLHAAFQVLVNFVEVRMSQTNWTWWEENKPRFMPKFIWKRVSWYSRNPEAGINHLQAYLDDEDIQGLSREYHQNQLDLYLWWTDRRVQRIEEWGHPRLWGENPDPDEMMQSNVPGTNVPACDAAHALEKLYAEEDQEMLERLVKLRPSLWY
jgi:hypothetical protein